MVLGKQRKGYEKTHLPLKSKTWVSVATIIEKPNLMEKEKKVLRYSLLYLCCIYHKPQSSSQTLVWEISTLYLHSGMQQSWDGDWPVFI